jgi:hypothetical protein
MSQFGIYISCHHADLRLARGCCESIRRFAGTVPICLIVDGDFSTRALERQYGCQVIRRHDVRDPGLRERSFGGWGYSKFILFWEGPFERFLYLDADTMMLGDLPSLAPQGEADMVVHGSGATVSDLTKIDTHWLHPPFLRQHFPEYRIEGRPYFVAGLFFARKGLFDLDRYLGLLAMQRANPKTSFHSGDQGIMNYLLFSSSDAGRLKYEVRHLQDCPLYKDRAWIDRLNANLAAGGAWPDPPVMLHYIDVKPSLLHTPAFRRLWDRGGGWAPEPGWSTAMNEMRVRSWQRGGLPGPLATARVLAEDLRCHGEVFLQRWKKRRQATPG